MKLSKVLEFLILISMILFINNEIYKLGYQKGYCEGLNKSEKSV
jgi:hypothetical protein